MAHKFDDGLIPSKRGRELDQKIKNISLQGVDGLPHAMQAHHVAGKQLGCMARCIQSYRVVLIRETETRAGNEARECATPHVYVRGGGEIREHAVCRTEV